MVGKNVDESEVWIANLNDEKCQKILSDTLDQFNFFNDILYKGSYIQNGEVKFNIQTQRNQVDKTR